MINLPPPDPSDPDLFHELDERFEGMFSGAPAPGRAPAPSVAEGLSGEFDALLDAVSPPRGDGPRPDTTLGLTADSDTGEMRDLFIQIAATYMSQVRDAMLEVRWGGAPRTWIAACQPVVATVRGLAERVELTALCAALDGFAAELAHAVSTGEPTVVGEARDRLLASYALLGAHMPQALGLEAERDRREPVIVRALLLQVPDLGKVALDKVYAAGVATLERLFQARADELAAVAGIPDETATHIVEAFQAYRRATADAAPDATHAAEHRRLGALASELRAQHDAFEAAAQAWSDEAGRRKKQLREARERSLLQAHVLLARLGEVDLVHQLEQLSFKQKVARIERYLADVGRIGAPPAG